MADPLKIRGLGANGLMADVDPYNLVPQDISSAVNVRFEGGKISRAPVFRRVHEYDSAPAFVLSIPPLTSGFDEIVTVNDDFSKVVALVGTSETDITPPGIVPSSSDDPFTTTTLENVVYLNRASHVPFYKRSGDQTFKPLTDYGWGAGWRCKSLRSFKNFLFAVNVTIDGITYPNMLKWSDIAGFNGPPTSWDITDTTRSAGEVLVGGMKTPIVDARTLGDDLVVYAADSVWSVQYNAGSGFLFQNFQLFHDRGALNPGCVVEVDRIHYVFDRNEIYAHDGSATVIPIATGKVRDFIYNGADFKRSDEFFVHHNPRLSEIMFCYVSGDALPGFQGANGGCNRAGVWNYQSKTWTLYSLPNVTSACIASVTTGRSWSQVADTWETGGGTWLSGIDSRDRHSLFVSKSDPNVGLSAHRLYGLDLVKGGRLNRPVDLETYRPAFIERVGIDLDDIGLAIAQYKCVQAVYPQTNSDEFRFRIGATDRSSEQPEWSDYLTFAPATDVKIDCHEPGRYLCWQAVNDGLDDFSLSGFDLKISVRGRR